MTRSSPTVRAEQARRRRERLAAAGLCQHPGRCGVRRRRRAVPGGTLCAEHARAQADRAAQRRSAR